MYRDDYNNMILKKVTDNNFVQEKYITITVKESNVSRARSLLNRIEIELSANLSNLGSVSQHLDLDERMNLMNELISQRNDFRFCMNSNDFHETFRDDLAPNDMVFKNNYLKVGRQYARSMYLARFPQYLKDNFISELC